MLKFKHFIRLNLNFVPCMTKKFKTYNVFKKFRFDSFKQIKLKHLNNNIGFFKKMFNKYTKFFTNQLFYNN